MNSTNPEANTGYGLAADTINIAGFMRTLWIGKWIIVAMIILGTLLGGYLAYYRATPKFTAETVVILETRQNQVVDLQSVAAGITGTGSDITSEVEVLRARTLLGKVVDRLGLITDPEFNQTLRETGLIARLRESMSFVPSTTLRDPKPVQIRDSVVASLLRAVSVHNLPQTHVFRISVETEDRQKSALIADTIAAIYISDQLDQKVRATEDATTWLSTRVSELQAALEEDEAEVRNFTRNTALVSFETLAALERRLKDQRDRLDVARLQLADTQSVLALLAGASDTAAKAAVLGDDGMQALAAQTDPDGLGAAAAGEFVAQQMRQLELGQTRAASQIVALESSIVENNAQITRQGDDLIALQQLTREADATRLLYEYFLSRFKETSAQEGIQQADSRVLSSAVAPNRPSAPNKRLALMLSGVLGGLFGVGFIAWREAHNDTFRDVGQIEALTGLPVLGMVPMIPIRRRTRLLHYLQSKPSSAAVDAIRNLRTSLLLPKFGPPPQVILSASSLPSEGKTTNSIALAQNLVGIGKTVLLMEGDIRRSAFSEYFDAKGRKGLVSATRSDVGLGEIVLKDASFGADILLGETADINAADFFSSAEFATFMDAVRTQYDYIIIDSPPVLLVPDARILARYADAVIFTVHWDKTSRQSVVEALRLLANVGQTVTGLVLSQINPRAAKAYGYDIYGYGRGNRYHNN